MQSRGEIPHHPLSLPHQWNIFAPSLKCPFDSETFLSLSYLKYLYTYMTSSLCRLYQYIKSNFESLFICRFCICLKFPLLKCSTSVKSLKNALIPNIVGICWAKILVWFDQGLRRFLGVEGIARTQLVLFYSCIKTTLTFPVSCKLLSLRP